jgi:hypothetical protein
MDSNVARLGFTNTSTNGSQWAWYAGTAGQAALYDYDNAAQRITITSSGNVGINVTDPIYPLEVQGEAGIELYNGTGGGSVLNFRPSLGDANKYNMSISSYDHSGGGVGPADGLSINGYDGVSFATGSQTTRQERMRITSSGNLLVGKASNTFADVGVGILANGELQVTREGVPLYLRRNGSDGDLVSFRKDGATVGTIGTYAGTRLRIGSNAGAGLIFGGSQVYPATGGAVADNTHDLGTASYRWKNLYLSGGVYLGGTGSANKLDDYEEGTWTPTVAAESNVSSTSVVAARYTKIGRIVTCILDMETSVTSVAAEARFRITLPFSAHQAAHYSLGSAYIALGSGANRTGLGAVTQLSTGATQIYVVFAANQLAASGAAVWARATLTYEAA